MISQRVAGIGVQEDVQRTVVQRQPLHDANKLRTLESELIRPLRMRANGLLMKPAELQDVCEAVGDFLAELPRGLAAGRIEIDVGVPALDCRTVEKGHSGSLGKESTC